jgi:isoleucyl-tRNA synthetase
MLDIDRWALARGTEFQAEVLAHFERFEFHPVVAKLQVFCSEDLGAFYLDVLKDRLYTTAPGSLARRSAQTALWHLTHAMLRWMAPFLSFTAEEAWPLFSGKTAPGASIFTETFWTFPPEAQADGERLARWARVRTVREAVNKAIEDLRAAGGVGSSLQAEVALTAAGDDHAALAALGDDLKFVLITSAATLHAGEALAVKVRARDQVPGVAKCARCWHWREDVGHEPAHPALCGRCTRNLFGAGEARTVA